MDRSRDDAVSLCVAHDGTTQLALATVSVAPGPAGFERGTSLPPPIEPSLAQR